nr:PTP4 [Anncaliia algerae]
MHFVIYAIKMLCTSQEIEPFLDKEIKIVFSGYPHVHLSELSDGSIGGFNRNLSPKEFLYDDNAKLSKNGEGYEIQIGGSKLCQQGNKVIRCKGNPNVWNIEKKTFGYNFKLGGKCITQKEYDKLEMQRCNEEPDKVFVFKLSSQMNNCEKLKESLESQRKSAMPKINIIPYEGSDHESSSEIEDKDSHHKVHVSSAITDVKLRPVHHKTDKLKINKDYSDYSNDYDYTTSSHESNYEGSIRKGYNYINKFLNLN